MKTKHQNKNKKFRSENQTKTQKLKINLFGMRAVTEAWTNPARKIKALYVTENALKTFEARIPKSLKLKRPVPTIIDKATLDKALPPGTVHQGIALNCHPLPECNVQDLIIAAEGKRQVLFLILDQVTDPHNVGAILRSADVFGAHGIIMQTRHAPPLEGVLAKTACGALEHVPVALETNLARTIETLKQAGYFIYALDERGETTMQNLEPAEKAVLMLGAEGPGLRRLLKEKADSLVCLPARGTIQNLNVSNAAAVALYAFTTKY